MTFKRFLTHLGILPVMALSLAIIFTWVFNHTKTSLFIAILLQTSVNANSFPQLCPAPVVTNNRLFAAK